MVEPYFNGVCRAHNRVHADTKLYLSRINKYVSRRRLLLFAVNNASGRFIGFITASRIDEADFKASSLGGFLHRSNGRVFPLMLPGGVS